MQYLKDGELPLEDHVARKLVLLRAQYEMIDDFLYHVEPDKPLRLIPTAHCRKAHSKEAQCLFGGHLHSAKIYGQLARHYWWPEAFVLIFFSPKSLYINFHHQLSSSSVRQLVHQNSIPAWLSGLTMP